MGSIPVTSTNLWLWHHQRVKNGVKNEGEEITRKRVVIALNIASFVVANKRGVVAVKCSPVPVVCHMEPANVHKEMKKDNDKTDKEADGNIG